MGIRSKGNPLSSFSDNSGNTGKEAVRQPHPGGLAVTTGGFGPFGSNTWRYHFFTEPGTFELTYGQKIRVFLIGGGGGGGANGGGGGGSGGVAHSINLPTGIPLAGSNTPLTATITVGQGGNAGSDGTPSTFAYTPPADPSTPITITALGGGAGAGPGSAGSDGGSGGGSGYIPGSPTAGGSGLQPTQNSSITFHLDQYGRPGGAHPGESDALGFGGGGGGTTTSNVTDADDAKEFGGPDGGYANPFGSGNTPNFLYAPIVYIYAPSTLRTTLDPSDPGESSSGSNNWKDTVLSTGLMGGGGGGGGNEPGNPYGWHGGGRGGEQVDANDPGPGNGTAGVNYTGSGGGGGGYPGGSGGAGAPGLVIVYYHTSD